MRIRISELKKIVRDVLSETYADGSHKSAALEHDAPKTHKDIEFASLWDDDMEDNEDYASWGEDIPDSQYYGTGPESVMADTEREPATIREPNHDFDDDDSPNTEIGAPVTKRSRY